MCVAFLHFPVELDPDPAWRQRVLASRALNDRLVGEGKPIYGVTTGFGDSCDRQLSPKGVATLQRNLLRFLGTGTGEFFAMHEARAILLARLNSNAKGYSGVRMELLAQMAEFLNRGITPCIPVEGSVGASGDLVPLSYLGATLCGERKVWYDGEMMDASSALSLAGLKPLRLEAKEGLAIVNGTSAMAGLAAVNVFRAAQIAEFAALTTAMTAEALLGVRNAFEPLAHALKNHPGSCGFAAQVLAWLEGSLLARDLDAVFGEVGAIDGAEARRLHLKIQDRYSIRCAPQIAGVLNDVLDWGTTWIERELNSANDNPLYDADSGHLFNAGNFYGGHVCMTMDALKVAIANVAHMCERQLELIVDEKYSNGLPANLVDPHQSEEHRAVQHGFKGVQLACTSLLVEALMRCNPASVHSQSTECHNQDKVSLGLHAARDCARIIDLTEKIVALQMIALAQALEIRGADRLGHTRTAFEFIRERVPFMKEDCCFDEPARSVVQSFRDNSFAPLFRVGRPQPLLGLFGRIYG
ncbi:MAG: hypothetical protein A3G25_21415 [Betaproteobacteria bacterium RIFCSPLOWO2_12_FULL_63_13]|nr:MAG: hypothetical protein A3G25_21415 [Betaproteobacteria bacterium RIFCSPLOWO2_12_FULL_63_13]